MINGQINMDQFGPSLAITQKILPSAGLLIRLLQRSRQMIQLLQLGPGDVFRKVAIREILNRSDEEEHNQQGYGQKREEKFMDQLNLQQPLSPFQSLNLWLSIKDLSLY